MKLVPDPATPGLWVNEDWSPGQEGAFAIVIGVSIYDYLDGSSASYGLNQLSVSAFTAYSFFRWLRDDYRCGGLTLAQCWLLLAPSQAERPLIDSELGGHWLAPTMQNCEDAIGTWYDTMHRLGAEAAACSRSFFFFSGHGLEVTTDQQVLLPQDYLRPPNRNVNRALSTQNLAHGVKALQVPIHFFFLDACRNDHTDLGDVEAIEGAHVLNVYRSSLNNPDCFVPLLYASASGTQAWQPADPARGASVYGQALLEGLRAQAGLQPLCAPEPCVVNLALLKTFVNGRVGQILQGYQATVSQRIRLSGEQTDEPVAEVEFSPDQALPKAAAAAAAVPDFATVSLGLESYTPYLLPYDGGHATWLLGGANMASIWYENARLCVLPQADPANPEWLPSNQSFRMHNVQRDGSGRIFRLELSLPPARVRRLYWLEFIDVAGRVYGCILPGEESNSGAHDIEPRYIVELEFAAGTDASELRPVTRMTAGLSRDNDPDTLGAAASLWQKYELYDARQAADSEDMTAFEDMLRGKRRSPLAASVAALILLRARRWDRLHHWLHHLAAWFPYLPDGSVLWVEQLLRQAPVDLFAAGATDADLLPEHRRHEADEVVNYLLLLAERGLPGTGEALAYAAVQVRQFLEYGELTPGRRGQLEAVQARLQRALRYFRSGGLFSCFAGPPAEINPGLVQGQPAGHGV